jgi:hypothetical protein
MAATLASTCAAVPPPDVAPAAPTISIAEEPPDSDSGALAPLQPSYAAGDALLQHTAADASAPSPAAAGVVVALPSTALLEAMAVLEDVAHTLSVPAAGGAPGGDPDTPAASGTVFVRWSDDVAVLAVVDGKLLASEVAEALALDCVFPGGTVDLTTVEPRGIDMRSVADAPRVARDAYGVLF